jgi:hypothetical protein
MATVTLSKMAGASLASKIHTAQLIRDEFYRQLDLLDLPEEEIESFLGKSGYARFTNWCNSEFGPGPRLAGVAEIVKGY